MSCHTVTTQAEIDAALADAAVTCIHVESPEGVWVRIDDDKGKNWRIGGSATVEWVTGSATVKRVDGSATVKRVTGSATVERAAGTPTIHLAGDARLNHAGPHVAVFLHSGQANVNGGHIIDLTQLDLTDPRTWCDHHGADVRDDNRVVLYKALDDELVAGRDHGRPTTYRVGTEVTAEDWKPNNECGGGLHLSPHPMQARDYDLSATRYVRVTAALADLKPIPGGTGWPA